MNPEDFKEILGVKSLWFELNKLEESRRYYQDQYDTYTRKIRDFKEKLSKVDNFIDFYFAQKLPNQPSNETKKGSVKK